MAHYPVSRDMVRAVWQALQDNAKPMMLYVISRADLAEAVGCTTKTVTEALKIIESAGVIARIKSCGPIRIITKEAEAAGARRGREQS